MKKCSPQKLIVESPFVFRGVAVLDFSRERMSDIQTVYMTSVEDIFRFPHENCIRFPPKYQSSENLTHTSASMSQLSKQGQTVSSMHATKPSIKTYQNTIFEVEKAAAVVSGCAQLTGLMEVAESGIKTKCQSNIARMSQNR